MAEDTVAAGVLAMEWRDLARVVTMILKEARR